MSVMGKRIQAIVDHYGQVGTIDAQALVNIILSCIILCVREITRYLGIVLMPLSGVLLNLAGFLQFAWNQHELSLLMCVCAGFVFMLGIISVLIFCVLTWKLEHPHRNYGFGFPNSDKDNNDVDSHKL